MEILTTQKGKSQLALNGYFYIVDKNDRKYTGNVLEIQIVKAEQYETRLNMMDNPLIPAKQKSIQNRWK